MGQIGRAQILILGIAVLVGLGQPAAAQVVNSDDDLLAAIQAANAAAVGSTHVITFGSDITLQTTLVPIAANITRLIKRPSMSGGTSR